MDAAVVTPSAALDVAGLNLSRSLKMEPMLSSASTLMTPRFERMQRQPSTASRTSARSRPTTTRSARILPPPTSVILMKKAGSKSPSKFIKLSPFPLAVLPVSLQRLQVLLALALLLMQLGLAKVVAKADIGFLCTTSAFSPLVSAQRTQSFRSGSRALCPPSPFYLVNPSMTLTSQ